MFDQLLEATGLDRSEFESRGELGRILRSEGVQDSDDVRRVLALDRRPECPERLIDLLSSALRLDPEARLRESQTSALRELYDVGGLFAPMRVGSGKTLVTLLAPTLLDAQRPVLLLPASLRNKTRVEFAEYRKQWRVRLPQIVSYEELGRPDREHRLVELAPDLLILDEAHRARNLSAACSRRIARAVALLHPTVCALSGTLVTDSVMDYWHILLWCLGERAPVPMTAAEAGRWSQALDREVPSLKRLGLGALEQLPGGFHEHMRSVRGVVPTPGSDCDASIEIDTWSPELPGELADVIKEVQVTRTRPDGELLEDTDVSDCLCQLACGFYYTWDPLPPEHWLGPRRAWNKYVRFVLEQHLPGFDSPSQVANALDNPAAPQPPGAPGGRHLLSAWREVRDTFEPNVVPVWIDDTPLKLAAKRDGLIWVRYRAAGERLAELGVPYYPGGTDPQSAKPGSTIALSIAAHGTGRNLQAWGDNTVMTPPANDRMWEQMIGRTHRAGQTRDTVRVSVYTVLDYHHDVMARVRSQARATSRASGFSMKLADATWV